MRQYLLIHVLHVVEVTFNMYTIRRIIVCIMFFIYSNNTFSIETFNPKNCNKLITLSTYSGVNTNALVNFSLYNQDLMILKQRYKLAKENIKPLCPPTLFEVSGMISGLDESNSYSLYNAELDLAAYSYNWINSFIDFAYLEPPPTPAGVLGNSNIYLDRVFITIGNLEKSPVYMTIGRRYLPFGQYDSYTITGSLAATLGKTEAGSLLLGYEHPNENGIYSSFYTLKGVNKLFWDSNQATLSGLTMGYQLNSSSLKINTGLDYIQSITVAQGFEGIKNKNIPGLDWHTKLEILHFIFLAEYTKSLNRFNLNSLNYYDKGAQPAATNFEMGYRFTLFNKPSTAAISYGKTFEAVGIGLPQKRLSVAYNLLLYSHAIFNLQYLRNFNYPSTAFAMSNNTQPLPKRAFLARIILYF